MLRIILFFLAEVCALFCVSQSVSFTNISSQLEVPHSFGGGSEMGGGVSFVDFNQDGLDDLTFTTNEDFNVMFYENNGQGILNELVTSIDNDGNTKHPLWADIDNDGDYDLFITANESGNKLYRNDGNMQFTDITFFAGLDPSITGNNSFGAVFADFNKDGNLDLYIVNRTVGGMFDPPHNIMHYGNGNCTFQNVSIQSGTQDSYQAPFCPIAFDYDGDSLEDIFIAQDKEYGNTMLKNLDGYEFSNTSQSTNSGTIMDAMNADVADLDGNGYLDVYVTNTGDGAVLLMNNGDGTFTDEAEVRGVRLLELAAWGGSFVDIDNDSDLDIFVSMGSFTATWHDVLFLNDGSGNFSEAGPDYGLQNVNEDYSFGNSFGDLNNDGFPDLAVNNQYTSSVVWQNSGNENNWMKYLLEGTASNRDGIGSLINFYVNGEKYLRTSNCGQGYLSQQSFRKTFGMGNAEEVDSLSILWPSGHVDWHYNLASGSYSKFTEGETFTYEVHFSNGDQICEDGTTVLSLSGDVQSVIWNGVNTMSEYTVYGPQVVQAVLYFEYGIHRELNISINQINPSLGINNIQGDVICPGELISSLNFEVSSAFPHSLILDGDSVQVPLELLIGTYHLQIVDTEGCSASEVITIENSPETVIDFTVVNNLCAGDSLGSILLEFVGLEPFSFVINDEVSEGYIAGLASGIYEVEVENAIQCVSQELIVVGEPSPLEVEFLSTPDFGDENGVISANVSGGTAPYTFTGSENLDVESLTFGTYSVEVCDSNNCCIQEEVVVEFEIGVKENFVTYKSYAFPNPTHGIMELVNYNGWSDHLKMYNMRGEEVLIKKQVKSSESILVNLEGLPPGIYILRDMKSSVTLELNKK